MSPRLRVPHWTAGAALAATALLVTVPASATSAHAPVRTPVTAAPANAEPPADVGDEADGQLAGSVAGVGRERPGRPAAEPASPEFAPVSRPVRPLLPAHPLRPAHPAHPARPTHPPQEPPPGPPSAAPSRPAAVSALGTEPNDRAADLAAHLLPLGTGLALMGLGLGFMGMRLRRGR
ncbi:hypothetical protein ACWDYJ_20210 [Streptomyces sp. NPDC003042]